MGVVAMTADDAVSGRPTIHLAILDGTSHAEAVIVSDISRGAGPAGAVSIKGLAIGI
jgi:hypothetical protein